MIPTKVGIRELKNQTSRLVRHIRQEKAEYIITLKGKPVAILRPFTEQDAEKLRDTEIETALAEMESLAHEIAAAWTSPQSGVELISEQRR